MRRAIILSILVVISLPVILLLGYQVYQGGFYLLRRPVTVRLQIQNTSGDAQATVRLRFKESGSRELIPLLGPSWRASKFHEITTDRFGRATVAFHEERLELESMMVRNQPITRFTTVFNRYDGLNFTNESGSEFTVHTGVYPAAKDPWQMNYTITVP